MFSGHVLMLDKLGHSMLRPYELRVQWNSLISSTEV